jgi:hypothetical protein
MENQMNDLTVREQLLFLLRGGGAHMPFEQAVADFPAEQYNSKPPNLTYSFWHLLEHIRIAQEDILAFIHNPDYISPKWPEGYWPSEDALAGEAEWKETLEKIHADMLGFEDLVEDPEVDLYAHLAHAPDYNIFREVLVVADHNAYHIGEFCILRQVMQLW